MAYKGKFFLDNDEIKDLAVRITIKEGSYSDILYEQYKSAYILSQTNYYRGDVADKYKKLVTIGTINIINEMLNITDSMTSVIMEIKSGFNSYESKYNAKINEKTLDEIKQYLKGKERIFFDFESELDSAINKAGNYITTTSLNLDNIYDNYETAYKINDTIVESIYEIDEIALKETEELLERIQKLKTFISTLDSYCYDKNGKVSFDNLLDIKNQEWYNEYSSDTLAIMMVEDPFFYSNGNATAWEGQWNTMAYSDVYGYATAIGPTAGYEAKIDGKTASISGNAGVFEAETHGQFTDYLQGDVGANILTAEGSAEIDYSGFIPEYVVEGEAVVAKAEESIVLGTDNINVNCNGSAEALTAEGKVAKTYNEDTGEFAYGVDASATLVGASFGWGNSLNQSSFKYENKPAKESYEAYLFSGKFEAKVGVGFSAYMERNSYVEFENATIYTNTVKLEGAFILGAAVEITVPSIKLDFPW